MLFFSRVACSTYFRRQGSQGRYYVCLLITNNELILWVHCDDLIERVYTYAPHLR